MSNGCAVWQRWWTPPCSCRAREAHQPQSAGGLRWLLSRRCRWWEGFTPERCAHAEGVPWSQGGCERACGAPWWMSPGALACHHGPHPPCSEAVIAARIHAGWWCNGRSDPGWPRRPRPIARPWEFEVNEAVSGQSEALAAERGILPTGCADARPLAASQWRMSVEWTHALPKATANGISARGAPVDSPAARRLDR